jgi:translocation and assembly module TamB
MKIDASRLAGVPVSGSATMRSAATGVVQVQGALDLAGNAINLVGRVATSGNGRNDAWTASISAPAIARLAPLARLAGLAGGDSAWSGSVNASVRVDGRWPALTSEGQLDANELRVGRASVQGAQARWQLASAADAPLALTLRASQFALDQRVAESLQLQVSGTGRSHRIELDAAARALPPAWVDLLQATVSGATAAPPTRSVARLQAQGGLFEVAGQAASGWRGTLQQLELGSDAAAAAPWLRSSNVALEMQWAGAAPQLSVQPGRAELLGAALHWSRITWQAGEGAAPAQLDALVELDPLPVAPLLARAQPGFGWGGDLAVGGRAELHGAGAMHAEVVLERTRGDLSVTDETGTQALGLTDLRLALSARDGVWTLTQGLAGTTLGAAAGAWVARTSSSAVWPSAQTPIEGVLELQVGRLATWGPWVPSGWRLDGQLGVSASIGGRLGAPEYTGSVRGSGISVRNFLQGVNVREGEVAIALQGSHARIERFSARAGDGRIALTGDASLGEAPQASLALTAERFQLLGRVDRRIVASGQAQLQLTRGALKLDGRFGIDEGLIDFSRGDAPSLADDVVVQRGAGATTAAAPATTGPSAAASGPPAPGSSLGLAAPRSVALDLAVDLGERLRLRGHGLDSGLRGELKLGSPGNRVVLTGTVRTDSGTYAAYGQKLSIDRGLLTFNGPAENPRLDIEATRPNLDVRVGVSVTGTAQNPRVRLFSEPELAEIDKLSWLVLGRASDGLGRTDTALLQRAAVALLSGEGERGTDPLTRAIGLDDVSLRQTDGEVRETVVSLGKQLSRRWYVGYERSLNATAGTWQLVYRIAQRFTLRAQSGEDNSLDMIWTWRWQ